MRLRTRRAIIASSRLRFAVLFLIAMFRVGFAAAWATEAKTPSDTGASGPMDLRELASKPVQGHPGLTFRFAAVTIEWGFMEGTQSRVVDGGIESTHDLGFVGKASPIPGDTVTTMTGDRTWRSPGGSAGRRGIVLPMVYTPAARGPERTIITLRTTGGNFSFQPRDLEDGPIFVKEHGFFIRAIELAGQTTTQAAPGSTPGQGDTRSAIAADLLKTKMEAGKNGADRPGWGSPATPCVYSNPQDKPVTILGGKIHLPARGVMVHPGPDRDVAVAWRSPLAGSVSVKATVAHAHPSGGNGIEWWIVHHSSTGRNVLCKGAVDRAGSVAIPSCGEVKPGDFVSLVIGNRGDYTCDSTAMSLTIKEAGGQTRTWDLARDVVDTLHTANPHPDSLGNAEVWHFYAPAAQGSSPSLRWRPPVVRIDSKATTAAEYLAELSRIQAKTIRQRVRELPEQTWENAMRTFHGDRPRPPFPQVPYAPAMTVEVPDANLSALWRIGAWQIVKRCPRIHREDLAKVARTGDVTKDCRRVDDPSDPSGIYIVRDNPFPPLGCETDRILWALDHMGMHQVARDGMSVWLELQQKDGALSLNSGMETAHRVGALQLPWVMAEHHRLTGDKQWLMRELPRLKAALDWIITRRRSTMNRQPTDADRAGIKAGRVSPYGLQPRIQMGDGDPAGANYFFMADAPPECPAKTPPLPGANAA